MSHIDTNCLLFIMDGMLGDNKNLKDSNQRSLTSYKANSTSVVSEQLSYTKTNKLVTALFMVTDIMDKEEPIRGRLRSLGMSVLSDTYSNPVDADKKIEEILVLLGISKDMRMISEMNSSILVKEFEELLKSIRVYSPKQSPVWLEEFLKDDEFEDTYSSVAGRNQNLEQKKPIGHFQSTRIGVQKGGTLLKALKGVTTHNANMTLPVVKKTLNNSNPNSSSVNHEMLRAKRREEIINIIKNKLSVMPESGGATITDIKNSAEGPLVSCGEKTLQRELVAMVHDGVLYKTGEKRWSKYSINKT